MLITNTLNKIHKVISCMNIKRDVTLAEMAQAFSLPILIYYDFEDRTVQYPWNFNWMMNQDFFSSYTRAYHCHRVTWVTYIIHAALSLRQYSCHASIKLHCTLYYLRTNVICPRDCLQLVVKNRQLTHFSHIAVYWEYWKSLFKSIWSVKVSFSCITESPAFPAPLFPVCRL